jgi:GT2 family glycosyltransferase
MVRVSVLIPVYNAEEYIEECLDSLVDQTFEDFEVVVVDDASEDRTPEILSRYEKNHAFINSFRNEKNKGVVRSRNKAFSRADDSSEYFAIMDSDDVVKPTRLEQQVSFLDAKESYGVVGSNTNIIDENGNIIGRRSYPETHEEILSSALVASPFAQPSVMIRSAALHQVGTYNEDYERSQDYELWFRLLKVTKGHNIQEPLTAYRLSETQGKQTQLKRTLWNTIKIQQKHLFDPSFRSFISFFAHLAHYPLLLLPNALVLWVFKMARYESV